MSREILVVTPENIEIEYELAGIGSRFLANLLDTFFQIAIFVAILMAAFLIALLIGLSASAFSQALTAFFDDIRKSFTVIAFFVVLWGYFIWFETRWNGQDARQAAGGACG